MSRERETGSRSLHRKIKLSEQWDRRTAYGLFVYFSVLVLLTDGIDIFDRERFERLIIWKK